MNSYNVFDASQKGRFVIAFTWLVSSSMLLVYLDFGGTANKENEYLGFTNRKDNMKCMIAVYVVCILVSIVDLVK